MIRASFSPPPTSQREAGLHGGAVPEGSRGLSTSDTPGTMRQKSRTQKGCQNHASILAMNDITVFDPSGVASAPFSIRGYRRCTPQPPATICQPSGLQQASRVRNPRAESPSCYSLGWRAAGSEAQVVVHLKSSQP